MIDSFMGKLTLQDGTIVGAVLNLSEDTLSVAAEGMTVGTWPLKYCRVSRLDEAEFVITIDGEPTTFHPVDAFRFAKAAADRFSASSLADRINVIRAMPLEPQVVVTPPVPPVEQRPAERNGRRPLLVAAMVVALAAVLVVAADAIVDRGSDEPEPVVVTTTVVSFSGPELFTLTPDAFRERWNVIAAELSPRLGLRGRFGPGQFREQITAVLQLTGEVDAEGTVAGIKVAITPTDVAADTELALSAIGVAIAVAEPTLDIVARTEILRELGFSQYPADYRPDAPVGEASGDGVRYGLLYIDLPDDGEDLMVFSLWEDQTAR